MICNKTQCNPTKPDLMNVLKQTDHRLTIWFCLHITFSANLQLIDIYNTLTAMRQTLPISSLFEIYILFIFCYPLKGRKKNSDNIIILNGEWILHENLKRRKSCLGPWLLSTELILLYFSVYFFFLLSIFNETYLTNQSYNFK